jgi:hypothetical protein
LHCFILFFYLRAHSRAMNQMNRMMNSMIGGGFGGGMGMGMPGMGMGMIEAPFGFGGHEMVQPGHHHPQVQPRGHPQHELMPFGGTMMSPFGHMGGFPDFVSCKI